VSAWASCSVAERCGPTGLACGAEDRACQSEAVQRGLEVVCEVREADDLRFVYCPVGTGQRDSNVVWLLLLAAMLIAVVGGVTFFAVVRKGSS
jgi:hypothetical protein